MLRLLYYHCLSLGNRPASSKHSDQRDPCVSRERVGGERPEETLRPGAQESAAGRVPPGKLLE